MHSRFASSHRVKVHNGVINASYSVQSSGVRVNSLELAPKPLAQAQELDTFELQAYDHCKLTSADSGHRCRSLLAHLDGPSATLAVSTIADAVRNESSDFVQSTRASANHSAMHVICRGTELHRSPSAIAEGGCGTL